MIRVRAIATALLLGLIAACTGGPTDAGRAAPIDITPSFQVDPSLFAYDPVDQIRLVARDASTSVVVGGSDDAVDPAASQWTMSLAIDLGDQTTIDVIVDVELLSQSVVQWSGRIGPIAVPEATPHAESVSLFRGSLDNLAVVSLTIQDAPSQLLEGSTATVTATPTLTAGSDVVPDIFWASSDPSVATVSSTGGVATVTAVSAGTADIIATAGTASDEFTVEVVASLASVTVSPSSATIVGLDGNQQFSAAVTDDLGNPDPNAVVTWASTNTSVATVDANGLATSVGLGTTQIVATSGGVSGQATLTVQSSAPSAVTVSPSTATIVGLDATQQFTATVLDADGNPDPNAVVTWASTNTGVATVDANGLATSVSVGTTQIVATSGGVSGQATLDVQSSGAPGQKLWVGSVSSDWQTAGNWNPSGVPGTADSVAIPDNASVFPILSADASVASLTVGQLTALDLGGFTLTVSGDVDAQSQISNGLVSVTGAGSVLQGYFPDLEVAADRVFSGYSFTTGNLLVAGYSLDLNSQSIQVFGDLTVQDGQFALNGGSVEVGGNLLVAGAAQLTMTVPNSAAYVGGDVTFDGGDESGLLTEGAIEVAGNFTVTGRSSTGFSASGNHRVFMVGSGASSVSLASPGAGLQHFNDFRVLATDGVTFPTGAYMTGDVEVYGSMVVPAASTVAIEGLLTLDSGSIFDVDGTVDARGGCTDLGAYITGTGTQNCGTAVNVDRLWVGGDANGPQDWQNANNWDPVGVPGSGESVFIPYRPNPPVLSADVAIASLHVGSSAGINLGGFNLSVSFDLAADGNIFNGRTIVNDVSPVLYGFFDALEIDAPRTLSGPVYLNTNLTVLSDLDVGANAAYVDGDLTVQGAGRLILQDVNSGVYVSGNADFSGVGTEGSWTDGLLWFSGNLTATRAISPQSFAPTGTDVYLDGTVDQSVVFSNPSATEQRFANLYINGTSANTFFETGMIVTGSLNASNANFVGSGGPIEVQGTLNLSTVTFDGMPLRLISTVGPTSHTMDKVTFTNMPGTASQLVISLPAAGPNLPLTLNSPVFTAPPPVGSGVYYIEATGVGSTAVLYIQLNNPTPASSNNLTKLTNADDGGW